MMDNYNGPWPKEAYVHNMECQVCGFAMFSGCEYCRAMDLFLLVYNCPFPLCADCGLVGEAVPLNFVP